MSGTSLDGLDLAYCHFWEEEDLWNFEIRQTVTVTYSEELRQKLENAIQLSKEGHEKLHLHYGQWLGETAKRFIAQKDLEVDFIASHGHTSHHRPDEGITFQLGDGQMLANASQHKVICDFRSLDVQLGGQGAPLVPIGDALLLPEYGFCLNLGGISNISFQKDGRRLAFDIGLANMPLNYLTRKIGLPYDENGRLAQKGNLLPDLLTKLNNLAYYRLPYPKSTGYEWFKDEVLPLLNLDLFSVEDLLHTLIHHNCQQIALVIRRESKRKERVLVSGGGAFNTFFIEVLEKKLDGICEVVVPPKKFIAFKEAMVFAFMGVLKKETRTNILASVTGAKHDSSSGGVFEPEG